MRTYAFTRGGSVLSANIKSNKLKPMTYIMQNTEIKLQFEPKY